MTTPMLMPEHPTEELLASYVDNRLDSTTREPVTDHLASCGECREIVLMTTAFQESERNVVHGNFGARLWKAAVAGLAAAAALAVFYVHPRTLFGPKVEDLVAVSGDRVAASKGQAKRVSDGRFAGGFAHSERPERTRGEGENADDANAGLYELALEAQQAIWSNPHVRGLSEMLIAEKGNFGNAIPLLEKAHQQARGKERDAVAIDLAAALLERAYWSAGSAKDNARALALSDEVLQRQPKSPEALWNRAVALASLDRDDEALRAFDDYLRVDPRSKWADEARSRKATIESYR